MKEEITKIKTIQKVNRTTSTSEMSNRKSKESKKKKWYSNGSIFKKGNKGSSFRDCEKTILHKKIEQECPEE